jgi:short-subunit dehydrogenase
LWPEGDPLAGWQTCCDGLNIVRTLRERNVLITGASGGLGVHICEALAACGANLAMVAYPGAGLQELVQMAKSHGVRAVSRPVDIRSNDERRRMLDWVRAELGEVDVLVNNAGVEHTSLYHDLSPDQITDMLGVNLEAPMRLAHALLPGMLQRRFGHIVNISSLAGKSGPACQEGYAATKAGLVAFSSSLRATYKDTGVSSSVICPGFVEAGIYSRIKQAAGRPAPALLAATRPEKVAQAVVQSIQGDKPEVIVSRYPIRPVLALSALWPSFGLRFAEWVGANEFFRDVAQKNRKDKKGGAQG